MDSTPYYVRAAPGEQLPDISSLAPFKTIVVLAAEYSDDWQNVVSNWLVGSGCRYMMAWGPNCSSWDDSVDWADLEARGFDENDQKFVLTTWHENETLESTFWHSQFCANFSYDDIELERAVVLDISEVNRKDWMLALFKRSATLAEREPD